MLSSIFVSLTNAKSVVILASVILAVVSSISTSGIAIYSSNIDLSIILILLTIVGGSLISTSSGLKYVRFYILFKFSHHEIYRLVKPINIFNRNLFTSQSKIDYEDTKISFLVFISFILGIFVLSAILTLEDLSFQNSFKLSILTLTNTTTSSMYGFDNLAFYEMSNFTKISLIIFMILAATNFSLKGSPANAPATVRLDTPPINCL